MKSKPWLGMVVGLATLFGWRWIMEAVFGAPTWAAWGFAFVMADLAYVRYRLFGAK